MPSKDLILEFSEYDLDHVVADIEQIRRINPQRHEMEQLTAIVHVDTNDKLIVAYKDVRPDEFWVRGHMPNFPLMPGVLMCEAAAQLCSYYITTLCREAGDFIAFGGMENVKFRGLVRPGDRLIVVAKLTEHRVGRRAIFACQGIVGRNLVFHGDIIGVPFSKPPSNNP